jgi:tetratricopeptide (TPR) repeat protein
LGIYLGASWVVIEFVGMLVDRYVLSPHLIDLSIVLLASLIPTVALLAYFHGAPGRDGWTRTERYFVPANLVLSVVLLAILFGGKELGAATETVVLEDDEGNTVERVVPKREFRKHAALFFFDNESGDSTLDWLRHGIVMALQMDLSQDAFLTTTLQGPQAGGRLAEAGFPNGVGVPLALKRQLARDHNNQYFVDGSFTRDGERYTIHSRLYETARGKELATRSVEGSDLFALIDQLSLQLRQDIGLGAQHIEGTIDLPVSERMTESVHAFGLVMRGVQAFSGRNDIFSAQRFLAEAVDADPTFAIAQMLLGHTYFMTNQREEADRAWGAGLRHPYRLPEKGPLGQLSLKAQLYSMMGDETRALQTAEYAAEVYPDDMWAHEQLARMYEFRRSWANVVGERRAIYELDPTRTGELRSIAWAQARLGQFDQAEDIYRVYLELEPEDPAAYRSLGFVYLLMGDHERARSSYERAAVIDPEDTDAYFWLGYLAIDLGEFDAASAARDQVMKAARSAPDSSTVFELDEAFNYTRGSFADLVQAYRLHLATILEYTTPAMAPMEIVDSQALVYAARWGETAFALAELDNLSGQAPERFRDATFSRNYLQVYLDVQDAENAANELARLQSAGESSTWGPAYSLHGQARLREISGDCESAVPLYEELVQSFPISSFVQAWRVELGRCLRKLRRYDEAEEALDYLLRQRPAQPDAHYELALVYADSGRRDDAIAHLDTALAVWAEADPSFRPAQRAQEKLAELTSG